MTTEERFARIEANLERVTDTLAAITDNQQKFDTVLSVLAEAQIKLAESQRAIETQWQAYLTTIRPQ